jgi:hypothetical protein
LWLRFFVEHQDYAEAGVYLRPVQLVGGDRDGQIVARSFVLHIERLREIFDEVRACVWDPFDCSATPWVSHVWIEGTYQGHALVFRVLPAPDGETEPEPMLDG